MPAVKFHQPYAIQKLSLFYTIYFKFRQKNFPLFQLENLILIVRLMGDIQTTKPLPILYHFASFY